MKLKVNPGATSELQPKEKINSPTLWRYIKELILVIEVIPEAAIMQ